MAIANISVPEKLAKEQLALLEKAQKKGKIKIGVNEATKAVERGKALLVLVAEDVNPAEIVMHLPLICREKNIPCSFVKTKKELGEKAGISIGTAAIAIVDIADAKKELDAIAKTIAELGK